MAHYRIIAFFGESGAGKDTVLNALYRSHPDKYNLIISDTTRPPREKEKDGVDYHFLSLEEFSTKVLNGEMLEATSFREWFYGTEVSSLKEDKINIGVFNIDGIKCLLEARDLLTVFPIRVFCFPKTRLLRILDRESEPDCEEVCRRYLADLKDFDKSNIDFTHIIIDNSRGKKELDKIVSELNKYFDI